MKKTVGLIGLGKMGLPVAANLLEHVFQMIVHYSMQFRAGTDFFMEHILD